MARAGTIAPLAKQALANGVSVDDLVKQHPELDEKALRRGYAQVKSKAKGDAPKAGKKKAGKKAGRKGARARKVAEVVAQVAPGNPLAVDDVVSKQRDAERAELRKLILQHGTKAIRAALADLES